MMQAFILAAGLGTRLRPLTDSRPKALVEVGGKPLLVHALESVQRAGASRVVVNVHHFGQQIIDFLAQLNFPLPVVVSDERGELLDTGGGLRRALPLLGTDDDVLVHNVDIFSTADFSALRAAAPDAAAVLLVSPRTSSRHLSFDENGMLCGWDNEQTGAVRGRTTGFRFAFSGIHLLRPAALRRLAEWEERPFGVMDFYLTECERLAFYGHVQGDLRLLDVGKTAALADAERFARL